MRLQFFQGHLLAIESSCDETSVAILDGRHVLSSIVASQAELHRKWGGVVPEAAARAHVESMLPVMEEALSAASIDVGQVQAVAVTNRPGLVGALSVGVTAAKAVSWAKNLPLIGVHHLEGHILSPLIEHEDLPFPHVCLMVSGGHTELVEVKAFGDYTLLGQTLDDAAGEAFDKAARLLGLGYPGGRAIQEKARDGDSARYSLPRGLSGDTRDFSFSGLKTAVLRLVEREPDLNIADAAASVQEAIVSVLCERAIAAAEDVGAVTLVGGVAANERLRNLMESECARLGLFFATPSFEYCTDNAAMIGIAGSIRLAAGLRDDIHLEAHSNAPLP